MATADFDGDGLPDIVVASQDGITLLRGIPGGGFAPPSTVTSLFGIVAVAASDLNGDGKMDIVAVGPNDVFVMLGQGGGSFAAPVHYNAGTSPSFVAAGDVNGDGRPDLVVTNINSSLALLINAGDGTFGPPAPLGTSTGQATTVLLADFNNDGNLDIYVAMLGETGNLFLGNGNGTFPQSPIVVSQGLSQAAFTALSADFNRDGNLDLAFVGADVRVAYGHGDGTFDAPLTVAPVSSNYGHSLAAADFNGDGWPDLVVWEYLNGLELILSDGMGGFLAPQVYKAGPTAVALLAFDFNVDGVPDVAVLSNVLTLLPGRAGGTLEATPYLPGNFAAAATADFNRDGKPDLVAGGEGITIWLGDGTGGFVSSYSNGSPTQVQGIGAKSLANNGTVDVVAVSTIGFLPSTGKLLVFRGDGAGSANPLPEQSLSFPPSDLWVGDLDGDGLPDLVIPTINAGVHILKGQGDGTFIPGPVLSPGVTSRSPVVRDFNGDGKLDIAVAQYANGRVTVYLGNGDGTFQAGADYLVADSPFTLIAEDLNGDGKLDLLTGNFSFNTPLSLLRGLGDGTFEPSFSFPGPFTCNSLAAVDWNGDGKKDIVIGDGAANDLLMMSGLGDGTFSASGRFATGFRAGRIVSGDWNGDGKPDLAVITVPGVSILLNTNCAVRRLGLAAQPQTCAAAPTPLTHQPAVDLLDDGDNLVSCETGAVTASLVPGKGSFGAVLGGATTVPAASGVAAFSNLSIDRAGSGFVMQFAFPGAAGVRSRALGVPAATGLTSVAAPSIVCFNSTRNIADVPDAGPGATYTWGVSNGAITSGNGTATIKFTAPASGNVSLSVSVTDAGGCALAGSRIVTGAASCGPDFYTVIPCRVVDTRTISTPALSAGTDRNFLLAGSCRIPSTAKAVSVNVAVTQTSSDGHLTLYPAGGALPASAAINYSAGQTRANNAILPLGPSGDITIHCQQGSGTTQVIIDVNGYFQ